MRSPIPFAALLALLSLSIGLGACSGARKSAPHFGFGSIDVHAEIERSDIVVMDAVQGRSQSDCYFFCFVKIVDGNKVRLFWVLPLYKEKYSVSTPGQLFGFSVGPTTLDRAYYAALEKAPDADVILYKRYDQETYSAMGLYSTETVTVRGKAVALRPDR